MALALLLGAGGGSAIVAGTPGEALPAVWKAVAASGQVEHLSASGEIWRKVKRGDELRPLALVRTGERGRTTLARGASVILVDPGSEIRLPSVGDAGDGVTRVRQSSGSAVYDIDGRRSGPVEIVTPYLVAGVKGTVFGVSVQSGYALVSVEEGVVEVRSTASGEARDLHAGEAMLVEATADARLEMLERERARSERSERTPEVRRSAQDALRRLTRANDRVDAADRRSRENDDDDRRADRDDRDRSGHRDEDRDAADEIERERKALEDELARTEDRQDELEEELRELQDDQVEKDPLDPGDPFGPEDPLDPGDPTDPGNSDGDPRGLPDPREHGDGDGR